MSVSPVSCPTCAYLQISPFDTADGSPPQAYVRDLETESAASLHANSPASGTPHRTPLFVAPSSRRVWTCPPSSVHRVSRARGQFVPKRGHANAKPSGEPGAGRRKLALRSQATVSRHPHLFVLDCDDHSRPVFLVRMGVICDKWNAYMELLAQDMIEGDAQDELQLKRYCCPRMVLTHVDLIERLLHYNPMER
ncbi:hypothetical protein OF83DRAFT_1178237 [Amylostereum chailletii]|nr:hypothetical protein OF83DRAFT_1178237 [Amylostereum chailletii]